MTLPLVFAIDRLRVFSLLRSHEAVIEAKGGPTKYFKLDMTKTVKKEKKQVEMGCLVEHHLLYSSFQYLPTLFRSKAQHT